MSGGIPRLRPVAIPLLSYGFRPFFLGAAVWAVLGMILWLGLLTGHISFATTYGAIAWHAHEFLFGYAAAVVTGFLLTAIPNWTGRLPLQGSPLMVLFLLWLAGRIAFLAYDQIGAGIAIAVDAIYLFALAAAILREIVAGGNWRNLKVVGLVVLLASANVAFHAEIILTGVSEYGVRLAAAAIIGLIMLVGGRITPSFTRNWLARQRPGPLPQPFGRFDMVTLFVAGAALLAWVIAPGASFTGLLLIAAATVQTLRLVRWQGQRTLREPLVLVLHLGYLFVPIGFLTVGLSTLRPGWISSGEALHTWTVGAVGVMTLAVMTRATLGHTGRALVAGRMTLAIYAAILIAALVRIAAPFAPDLTMIILTVSASAWIAAFGLFVLAYGPMLIRARRVD